MTWSTTLYEPPEALRLLEAAQTYRITTPIPDIVGYSLAASLEMVGGTGAYNATVCRLVNGDLRLEQARSKR